MNTTRRRTIRNIALLAVGSALAACAVQTVNGVTTVTINTATLNTDGQAIITAANSVLANPLVVTALGANLVAAKAALTAASATMAAIATATNGVASASVNTTSVQALVTSLLADVQTFLKIVAAVAGVLVGDTATLVEGYITSIEALIPFVQLAVSLATSVSVSQAPKMSESRAVWVATH